MDWRREDWGYAAGTLVAAAFVGYLVAGNFGLVRTPFGAADAAAAPSIPTLAALSQVSDGGLVASPLPSPTPAASGSSPAVAVDATPPVAQITSPGGTRVSATQGSVVSGIATDAGSGVDTVVVTFDPGAGEATSVPATVSCEDASRMNCTWSARVPGVVGSYEVTARATDRSGNATSAGPSNVNVVNLGGPVQDLLEGPLGESLDGLSLLLSGLLG